MSREFKPMNPSSTSPQARQKNPHRPLPRDITTTPPATHSPVSPYGASSSTPRSISPHRTEAVEPASNSDVVTKILESVAQDHAAKAAKEERVLSLNGFVPAPVSIESTELQTNQSAVRKPLASVHPRQPSITTTPLIPQEILSQPLPPSANSMPSSPSPFPSTRSMASTTTQPLSALDNQSFREPMANGSLPDSFVPSLSRSIAAPFREIDMDNTPQLPQTEKAGDVSVSLQKYHGIQGPKCLLLILLTWTSNGDLNRCMFPVPISCQVY
ncbi:hypothetical protein Agabi119p4_9641 [Agaricus bisporus var. burnettii]|uniref:Uncharacterized protein n=1 Tax=Agaricus bisporus var. burnettii TaxID=192524 RepID=A0A8H7EX04_AGABI|nr:hypothetical protein Agabi119p4_9641 [Agaricus bisporus var. burnettii]